MAVTIARVADGQPILGHLRAVIADVTFDTSYPAGGESIAAADVGLKRIMGAIQIGGNAAAGVLQYLWDTTNNKLLAFFPTGGATAAPTSLADPIVTTGVASATAVDATTPNITPGRAKEVGATINLSTITVRMLFFGY